MARDSDNRQGRGGEESLFVEKLVSVNRVAKVVKGGRRFRFSALAVVGDGKGRVGYASGKAKEVPEAVNKAMQKAQRRMVRIPLRGGHTLHHDVVGRFGSGKVMIRAAPPGTGIIAGGPIRALFEALGVSNVVAKSIGSTNPHNMVRAAFRGLTSCESPRSVAYRRGKRVADVIARRPQMSSVERNDGAESPPADPSGTKTHDRSSGKEAS